MRGTQGKNTRDFNSIHAHTLKVNKLKTTAYPFQPARVSDDCAWNGAAKKLSGDACKMKVAMAMGTIRYFKKSTQYPPMHNHHHLGQLGADGVTTVCTKPPFPTRGDLQTKGRWSKYYFMS